MPAQETRRGRASDRNGGGAIDQLRVFSKINKFLPVFGSSCEEDYELRVLDP
jgi:hypothetical protein